MWILVVILGSFGAIHFLVSISLLKKISYKVLAILTIAIIPVLYHSFALQTNFNIITKKLSNLEFVSGLVALEIAVLIISSYFSIDIIKNYFNTNKKHKFKRFLSLIPSVFFIVGIILLQLWLFYTISGIEYIWLSLGLALALFTSFSVFTFFFNFLFKDWILRLELKSLLSFLLIIGVTLLPVFFQKITIISLDKSSINKNETLLILASIIIISSIGLINYKYQILQNIWKRFTKS